MLRSVINGSRRRQTAVKVRFTIGTAGPTRLHGLIDTLGRVCRRSPKTVNLS
jgi:hypothetical protein